MEGTQLILTSKIEDVQTLLKHHPRPSIFDEDILKAVAGEVAKFMKPHRRGISIDDAIEDAKKILESNYNDDGFQLAKEFEDEGYSIDASVVDELDCVQGIISDATKEQTKIWVKQFGIELHLKVGQKVIFDAWTKNNDEGEIVKLYPETAQYVVWSPTINKPNTGLCGYIIDFERIKSAV